MQSNKIKIRDKDMERKIGEVFKFNDDVKLKVIENNTCGGCYFYEPDKCDCLQKRMYDVTGLCSRARSDGQDVIFAKIEETMTTPEYARLEAQIAVLREVAEEYPGKTIENIIVQLEARKKEVENAH